MGEMKRAIAWEQRQREKEERFSSTIVIAASFIAAIRLAKEDISQPSPRVNAVVADSVKLATTILNRVVR